jgi:hypothetical protein
LLDVPVPKIGPQMLICILSNLRKLPLPVFVTHGVIFCETQRLALPQLGRLRFYVIEFFFDRTLFLEQIHKCGSFCTKEQGQTRFLSRICFSLCKCFLGIFPLS